jgi:hypothetical protein
MQPQPFRRFALATGVAASLAGCGGSQPPIGAPGAMPQTSAAVTHAARGKSWMLSEAKTTDLVYASDEKAGDVYVFSYPKGRQVGTLTGFQVPLGECVDASGNVWIVDGGAANVTEFHHGGTTPISSVTWPGILPMGCSVDRTTGDLAVTSLTYPAQVGVYQSAQGTPTLYSSSDYSVFYYCAYDDDGNLFVSGKNDSNSPIAELLKGSQSLVAISVNQTMVPSSIQWDGSYLAVADLNASGTHGHRGPTKIYRLQISGSTGTVASTVQLVGRGKWRVSEQVQYWIEGKRILGPGYVPHKGNQLLDYWAYPAGGKPRKIIEPDDPRDLFGTVMSKAASH